MYEQILESMGSGVIATDAAGRIVYMNQKAADMANWTSTDILHPELHQLLPEARNLFDDCLRSGESQPGRYLQRKDSKLVMSAAPIKIRTNLLIFSSSSKDDTFFRLVLVC